MKRSLRSPVGSAGRGWCPSVAACSVQGVADESDASKLQTAPRGRGKEERKNEWKSPPPEGRARDTLAVAGSGLSGLSGPGRSVVLPVLGCWLKCPPENVGRSTLVRRREHEEGTRAGGPLFHQKVGRDLTLKRLFLRGLRFLLLLLLSLLSLLPATNIQYAQLRDMSRIH